MGSGRIEPPRGGGQIADPEEVLAVLDQIRTMLIKGEL